MTSLPFRWVILFCAVMASALVTAALLADARMRAERQTKCESRGHVWADGKCGGRR